MYTKNVLQLTHAVAGHRGSHQECRCRDWKPEDRFDRHIYRREQIVDRLLTPALETFQLRAMFLQLEDVHRILDHLFVEEQLQTFLAKPDQDLAAFQKTIQDFWDALPPLA